MEVVEISWKSELSPLLVHLCVLSTPQHLLAAQLCTHISLRMGPPLHKF